MATRRGVLAVVCVLAVCLLVQRPSARTPPPVFGTTIITHGFSADDVDFELEPIEDTWMFDMACAIRARAGGGQVGAYDPASGWFYDHTSGCPATNPALPQFGETVLVFDWRADSDNPAQGYAEAAGDALFTALLAGEKAGHFVLNNLHFIGHSRGTVVNSEAVERVLASGRPVAHVTNLDPHDWGVSGVFPTDCDANPALNVPCTQQDGSGVVRWKGVGWADTYYQTNHFNGDLDGRPVQGTYNYTDLKFFDSSINHSAVHDWYFNTITSSVPHYGYYWSRIGQGDNVRPALAPGTQDPFVDPVTDGIVAGDFGDGQADAWIVGTDIIPGWIYHGGQPSSGELESDVPGDLFVPGRHLDLDFTDPAQTHNRFYIPPSASRLHFNVWIRNIDAGSPPNVDQLAVSIGSAQVTNLSCAWDSNVLSTIWLNDLTNGYATCDFDVTPYRDSVRTLTFEIVAGGFAINSEVWIDGVGLERGSPNGSVLVYVVDANGNLGTVDVTNGTSSVIGNTGYVMTDVAASATGELWAVDFYQTYRINRFTGAASYFGSLLSDGGMNALVNYGTQLLAASTLSTNLYLVDTATGQAAALGGSTGYVSSGDLAFHGGSLYETVVNGGYSDLVRINVFNGAYTSVNLGHIAQGGTVFSLVEGSDDKLYGIDGTTVWRINTSNPSASVVVVANYAANNSGLGPGNGAASGVSVNPEDTSAPDAGVNGATLTVTAIPGCVWSATSNVNWITISSGLTGIGSGSVTYAVAPNPGAPRTGTMSVGGNVITIRQGASATTPAPITIRDGTTAQPYPSTIQVSGLSGTITSLSVTLQGLSHTWPADIDMVLVGPGGQAFTFMSDVGDGTDIVGGTLTFTDTASGPPGAPLTSGVFKPTDIDTLDSFQSPGPGAWSRPAPSGSATFASVFGGTNPNGTWRLYIVDDAFGDQGSLAGWSLNIAVGQINGNVVQNSSFNGGTTGWLTFAIPDLSYLVTNVTGGVLNFYRNPPPPGAGGQATVFQQTGLAVPAGGGLAAQFDLGNTSTVRKRISVLLIEHDFSDIAVCYLLALAPNAPLRTYRMRTNTTKAWTNAAIYFYAATAGSDGGAYLLDNATLQLDPTTQPGETECIDPTAPIASNAPPGPELITNGSFGTGTLAGWSTFGQLVHQVSGGAFEFYRPPATPDPAGVILQPTQTPVAAGEILTAQFQLGNSSAVRKRVTVLLHDLDFSDLSACTFWLAPGQPLSAYGMRTFATEPWSNATVSIYAASVGNETWSRLDNVSLRKTMGAATNGTDCVEPGGSLNQAPPDDSVGAPQSSSSGAWASASTAGSAAASASSRATVDQSTRAGAVERVLAGDVAQTRGPDDAIVWLSSVPAGEVNAIALGSPVDLRETTTATLRFTSWRVTDVGEAEVQISLDDQSWISLGAVPATTSWTTMDVDLSEFAGQLIFVRFVHRGGASGAPADWFLSHITLLFMG